jgi:hypothetical protein
MAVNHFLDRLEKRLQFEVAIVPLATGSPTVCA